MTDMRAKFKLQSVEVSEYGEKLKFSAITGNSPEDNSYSKYTPSAQLEMTVTNPDLHGKFKPGQSFYVDFTRADVPKE